VTHPVSNSATATASATATGQRATAKATASTTGRITTAQPQATAGPVVEHNRWATALTEWDNRTLNNRTLAGDQHNQTRQPVTKPGTNTTGGHQLPGGEHHRYGLTPVPVAAIASRPVGRLAGLKAAGSTAWNILADLKRNYQQSQDGA